ncbi:MerR family transcriptional regulator, partial [Brachybacterium alimentarium]|uniref:MerR family transcriptional regulator n=1 Tax=Brachybacterium alimentarium TaxID=47845 RepID=UPI0011448AEF
MSHEQTGPGLLSIGELAAASGLSPKALRMYAESGLLAPRRVDPFTGYRSYGADQIERARLIESPRVC